MNRDILGAKADGYRVGLEQGREQGIAMQKSRQRRHDWERLEKIVFWKSFKGASLAYFGFGVIAFLIAVSLHI